MYNPTEKELLSLGFSPGSPFMNNYWYEKIVGSISIKKWNNGGWQIVFSPSLSLTIEVEKEQDISFLIADTEKNNIKAKEEERERIVGILNEIGQENLVMLERALMNKAIYRITNNQ